MAFAYADFIAAFPAFSDATKYPQASFTFWLGVAGLRLDANRWGDYLDYGSQLFIAHNLATAGRAGAGTVTGPTSAKSIDKLSKSMDVSAVTIEGAGDWNSTTYGIQFYQLMLMMGSGGMQF